MMPFDLLFTDPRHPVHEEMMGLALEQAALAGEQDEVPVGCVIVHPEQGVVAAAGNQKERLRDPTAHAEIIAITQAAAAVQSWRLDDCMLYVTLEPCPMCAGAIVQARLPVVIFGCLDAKAGACQSLYQITSDSRLNHRCRVISGVRSDECAAMLGQFFVTKRKLGKS